MKYLAAARCEIMTFGHCEISASFHSADVKRNKSPHARRHFTRRRRISCTQCISQIPTGIYFIENSPHARRHFTRRRRISCTQCISQIPTGIYFVEKSRHPRGVALEYSPAANMPRLAAGQQATVALRRACEPSRASRDWIDSAVSQPKRTGTHEGCRFFLAAALGFEPRK